MSDPETDVSTSPDSWPITEEWLLEILQNIYHTNDGIQIQDFNVELACQNGVSNLSELLAVKINYFYNKNRQINLIIKLLPNDPFSRYFVTEAQFDYREIKFYTKILPDLQEFQLDNLTINTEPMMIAVPTCFHTHYIAGTLPTNDNESPEAPDSILVIEDMRKHGYKAAHFIKGLNLAETKCAVRAIAVIHALSLGLKFKGNINLNEKYPFLFQTKKATDSYQQLVEQGLPQLSQFLEKISGHERELVALANIRPKTRSIIENLLQPVEPMALITHTDFWCNNLLIKDIKDEELNDNCIIIDWQMVTCSRPTNDIALLIISSLPASIRREHTEKLLDLYHVSLKDNLKKINIDLENDLNYTRQKLGKDYRESQLLALLLCIGSVDIALGNENAEQRLLDVLGDLYDDGILNIDEISF